VSALGIDQAAEPDDLDYAEQAVRRVFAIDQSPQPFYDRVAQDRVLGPLSKQLYGLRPLGSPSIFEMLVTAILGQQISMVAAHAIKERLVLRLGAVATIDGRTYHAFPTPDRIALATGDELVALKFSRRKAEYVRDLATAVSRGHVDLEALRGLPHDEILEHLMAIRGIGRWTAEYVLLRGYGYPDALPAGDAGLRRQVTRHYALSRPPTEDELSAIAEAWRPFRSWATLYLWSAEWAAPS
jgi:DNA-3-methyladenine glycosylase II